MVREITAVGGVGAKQRASGITADFTTVYSQTALFVVYRA
jgi:hypothetical protein